MSSWAPKVIADSSGEWSGNALRFATEREATAYLRDLAWRWLAVVETRAEHTSDPITHRWDENRNQALPVQALEHASEPTPQ